MNFPLHVYCNHVWSFVKSATNITYVEFLQFCQVASASATNWHLKLKFYSVFKKKNNKFDPFEKTKKWEVLKQKHENGNDS